MQGRVIHPPLVILIGTSVVALALGAIQGPSVSLLIGAMSVGTILLYSFAMFEALTIRRALAVGLYRGQALGVGLVAVGWVLNIISMVVAATFFCPSCGSNSGPFGEPITIPFVYFSLLVIFYWIDSSIRAARRSDPLFRDSLHWSRVRIAAWAITLGSIALYSGFLLYLILAKGLPIDVAPNLPPTLWVIFGVPFFVLIPLGTIFLPVSIFRSKDPTLRRHLVWFGVFVLMLLGQGVVYSGVYLPVPSNFEALRYALVNYLAILVLNVAGYFLYRSARSLAPLNRISLDELIPQTKLETAVRPDAWLSSLAQ